MRPVIGITTQVNQTPEGLPQVRLLMPYIQALLKAGAAPLLLPSALPDETWDALYASVDGILFSGGGDITPARYDGQMHPRVNFLEPDRDEIEHQFLQACLEDGKPFLGICRGIQIINVVLGGSLYEDLSDLKPNALKHDYYPNYPRDKRAHAVRVEADSWLAQVTGAETLQVNSLHHQGIRELADALRPLAWAPDDLVEAVEVLGHPFGRGVQWHPEWLAPHDDAMQALFDAFVEAVLDA